MGYIAVKGGQQALEGAERFLQYRRMKGDSPTLDVAQIRDQLPFLVDRVMGEGSCYAPDLAAVAIKQAGGDTLEAAFILRAYRTTQPRVAYSAVQSTEAMRVERRISAAFKEIPEGQVLGATPDYTLRLLDFELAEETDADRKGAVRSLLEEAAGAGPLPETFPKVVEMLRREGLLVERRTVESPGGVFDVTREALSFPAPQSAALQTLARGETGGVLALAYSNMRGYGVVHPTVGELRVGTLPLRVRNPHSGDWTVAGEVRVTEAEIVSTLHAGDGPPRFALGYGLCFGQNEAKAISMAVLDRAMQTEEPTAPSEDQEFVLQHVDGIESMGFCNHFKLPHYVTFQSGLDRLRKARDEHRRVDSTD